MAGDVEPNTGTSPTQPYWGALLEEKIGFMRRGLLIK
jgi:hypothetical protein